ncbi:MAG: cobyric acid synthase [Tissierellia bacterium]|nr:cobyric acid synthase [Tissierellia bacterium]
MAKTLMILGTTSNAGKSLVTAGLCRILAQDGYKVAPFKAQNMALNSFITEDGLEMGRAQVIQAEAAGLLPDVRMNPILLKPTTDRKSQVIVNGKVWKDLSAKDYYKEKKNIFPKALDSFYSLCDEYDIVICEGAGSPSEINLKEVDIVNMGFAKAVNAPAIIVGDIDRGGVFASLAGTIFLFDERERELTKGFLINKFRGDPSILEPGLVQLEEITKVPTLGVIPYLDVDIEEEDSLAEELRKSERGGIIDIGVIRLPHISNFTDFHALSHYDEVNIRYIQKAKDFGDPDFLIIPGTKNTLDDLKWIRESGLDTMMKRHSQKKKPIFGICGGYQILGEHLSDPYGVESGGEMKGLGLLPTKTIFSKEKTTRQTEGKLNTIPGYFSFMSNESIKGYEIHMGHTSFDKGNILGTTTYGDDGCVYHHIAGTYIHGFFDQGTIAKKLIEKLLEDKGITKGEIKTFDYDVYKKEQYDLLAKGLRNAINLKEIYNILGI